LLRRTRELIIYHTDNHDVDEDLKTFSAHGGYCQNRADAGVAQRNTRRDVSYSSDVVASLKKHRALQMKECPMRMLSYNFKVR